MSKINVKICGVKTKEALETALANGAAYIGFNFFAPSPRATTPEKAGELAKLVNGRAKIVAVTVDPDDALLDAILKNFKPDFIQLHGKETPQRAAEIKARTHTAIIKALPISDAADFDAVSQYQNIADGFLFDGKAPEGAKLPGGNAISFDWALLKNRKFSRPWLLAGGLNAKNLKEAVTLSNATQVDISSGVESAPGEKDTGMIKELLHLFP